MEGRFLTSESVEGAALTLQSIDDVHGSDGLSLGVLSVGDGISDDVLKEDLEDTTGLLVDEARDTLDTATARQTADGGLGDALDVVPEDLPVALGASLSESLASLAASSHDAACSNFDERMMSVAVWGCNLWGETRAKKGGGARGEFAPFRERFPSLFSRFSNNGNRVRQRKTRAGKFRREKWEGEDKTVGELLK